jgi:capsule polysaccharide export protein KpsE/RkpR
MDSQFNPLIKILYKRRFHLLIILIISISLSALFSSSWFIQPEFRSQAVFYPSNMGSYGSETPVEQSMQVLESADIYDSLNNRFNLLAHYKVNTSDSSYYSDLIKELKSNISVSKTRFESIEIDVLDKNPVIARDIALAIIDLHNLKVKHLQKKRASEVTAMYVSHLENNKKELDSIEDILSEYRNKYNLLHFNIQAQEVTRGYFTGGNKSKSIDDEAKEIFKNLEKYGGDFMLLSERAGTLRTIDSQLRINYSNALMELNKELSYADVISYPKVADKKAYPIRWLIVLTTTIAVLIFAVVLFTTFDQEIKKT